MRHVAITGTGLYTPDEVITNEELVDSFNTYVHAYNDKHADAITKGEIEALAESSAEFIEKASGIKRRYVRDKENILDINRMYPKVPPRLDDELSLQAEACVVAAKQALQQANLQGSDLDFVIVACSNFQRPYPAISIEVQHALGAKGYAFDMNVACSSATFGIQTAYNAIATGQAQRVLVVSPELSSTQIDYTERDSHFIFGEACTAIILEDFETTQSKQAFVIQSCQLATQYSNNIRCNHGCLARCEDQTEEQFFKQQGRKVFKEVVPWVIQHISSHVATEKLTIDQIKCLWLHQANINMNRLIAEKLLGKEPAFEQAPVTLDEYANTAAAGSIIAFHHHRQGFQPGEYGIICSFGAGYSAGSILLQYQTKE